jgi:hypothetical protein
MGFLRTDYSEVGGFGALPIGEYECIISEVKMTKSSTGKDMVKVTLTVRDDVEQEGKKRKFFDNFVVQENMMWKFQQVSKAAQIDQGVDVESPEHFAQLIQYKAVCIKNKHEEYNGDKQDRVAFYMEPKVAGGGSSPVSAELGGGSIDVGDDDLPF